MIEDLEKVQKFVQKHRHENIPDLLLKYQNKVGFDLHFAVQQIQALQKNKKKLPTLSSTPGILFPPDINLQQSSSELTANYKSDLIRGKRLADLTGGFGVDTTAFSKTFDTVFHIEPDKTLQELTKHNIQVLGIKNIQFINTDAAEFLAKQKEPFDCIFLDPSRRKGDKKVFNLTDYSPNLVELESQLWKKTDNLLIKTAPFLDISLCSSQLKCLKEIHIVSVKNEVKEVLYLMQKRYSGQISLFCSNLDSKDQVFVVNDFFDRTEQPVNLSFPEKYLYEPNASIMKAGVFNQVASTFNLNKLHQNTHIYTSDNLIQFPGKAFELISEESADTKKLKKKFGKQQFNIILRNYPAPMERFRKETNIKDGGDNYLIGCTNLENKPIILNVKRIS